MYIVNNAQMKAIEQKAIMSGVPSLLLMENAAMSLTKQILADGYKSVLLFCGKGNNGGDGIACARQLNAYGINVNIIFVGEVNKATEDCTTNLTAAKALNIPIVYYNRETEDINDIKPYIDSCDMIVDALIGTGLSSELHEPYLTLVDIINSSNKPVYSMDCPTGVSTDSGDDFNHAVYANKTVTFHMPKVGLMLYPACEHTGELIVGNISLPNISKTNMRVLSHEEAFALIPKRKQRSDKSTYGRVFAFVGCDNMTGAAVLSLTSAYRIGAGLVYGFSTAKCCSVIQNRLPEAVVNIVDNTNGYINSSAALTDLERAGVVLIGCGLGNNNDTHSFLSSIIKRITTPLVLDADALNIISADENLKTHLPANAIVTPHPKEMSRLTGLDTAYILKHPIEVAQNFAKQYNVVTVLKDFRTIIASPSGNITINITGTPAMAKGGSGDCLAGIISGLVAQGVNVYDAACLGCYISGKAGEIAENELSSYGVLASDLCNAIPYVFH